MSVLKHNKLMLLSICLCVGCSSVTKPVTPPRQHVSADAAASAISLGMTASEVGVILGGEPNSERLSSFDSAGRILTYVYADKSVYVFLKDDKVVKVTVAKVIQ